MSLPELLAQRAEIDRQIAAEKANRLASCVQRALAVFTDEGFTQLEAAEALIARFNRNLRKAKPSKGPKSPPKYRRTDGPETWTGRGVQPAWFRNGNYAEI